MGDESTNRVVASNDEPEQGGTTHTLPVRDELTEEVVKTAQAWTLLERGITRIFATPSLG